MIMVTDTKKALRALFLISSRAIYAFEDNANQGFMKEIIRNKVQENNVNGDYYEK